MELVVQRRKIPARVRLADSTSLDGALYTAVEGRRGAPESLADRLNDTTERYLPFALEDRHLLLNKAHIVVVELPEAVRGSEEAPSEDTKEFRLMLRLADRTTAVGTTRVTLPPERTRALDYLNTRAARFIDLLIDERIFLVNRDYVVAVTEVFSSDLDGGVWAPFGPLGEFAPRKGTARQTPRTRDES